MSSRGERSFQAKELGQEGTSCKVTNNEQQRKTIVMMPNSEKKHFTSQPLVTKNQTNSPYRFLEQTLFLF